MFTEYGIGTETIVVLLLFAGYFCELLERLRSAWKRLVALTRMEATGLVAAACLAFGYLLAWALKIGVVS